MVEMSLFSLLAHNLLLQQTMLYVLVIRLYVKFELHILHLGSPVKLNENLPYENLFILSSLKGNAIFTALLTLIHLLYSSMPKPRSIQKSILNADLCLNDKNF